MRMNREALVVHDTNADRARFARDTYSTESSNGFSVLVFDLELDTKYDSNCKINYL